jgi:RNA polymerase sigma-70 factor (sigma-E family)
MMTSVALDDVTVRRTAEDEVASLFRTEYAGLVRMASLLLGDRAASEEVVQDAFVKLHVSWSRVREPAKAPAWLRTGVLTGARSRPRHRQVRRRHLVSVPPAGASPESLAMAGDDHRRVMAALRTLPQRQREALVLKFYLDLSEAETAAAMGVSAGAVKTHVHRGLAALQSTLGTEEDR